MDHTEISGDQEMLKCERPSVGVREVPDQDGFVFTGTQREVQLVESGEAWGPLGLSCAACGCSLGSSYLSGVLQAPGKGLQ